MAARYGYFPDGQKSNSHDQVVPSLAAIMKEQQAEEKQKKSRPQTQSKSGFTFTPQAGIEKRSYPYKRPGSAFDTKTDSTVTSLLVTTKVVNVRKQSLRALGYQDLVDWLKNPDHVYVGRDMTVYVPGAVGSKWGNPFKNTKGATRESVCERYKEYVKTDAKIQANGKTLLQSLGELKGKTLGCWCHPEMCHGHMLAQLIEEYCG